MTNNQSENWPQTIEWLNWMVATSVPLYRLGPDDSILARASGCLVRQEGRLFVLATPHAVARGSAGWAMDLNSRLEGGTEMLRLKHFAYAGEAVPGKESPLRETDLCFSEIPADAVSMYRFETPRGKFDERPRYVFTANDWADPNDKEVYAFAGQVGGEFHESVNAFVTEMEVFPGLKFLRQEGEKFIFQLPVDHPGHAKFRGCSGAPIVGRDRRPVALLTNGTIGDSTVSGISLTRYRSLLDMLCPPNLAR